ncbi:MULTISPECIES: PD-(D/E)XK nuclease-like domain-containing protein [unclassified Nocardia]|uniref:PD-(D/E)XK nuclease-like domain-containing protein n=1 Tax=unclassified Nocardia TaxID=2637762 RepID=UPI00278BD2A2|nr:MULTISPECIES: PD-(D/E)XK nuclease-like domain-containing protein [unclassified Nocardia]
MSTAAPTAPGLYSGVPEAVYHGDRNSLSSSGARRLLKVTPWRWKFEQDNPDPPTDAFDLGTAVHTIVLGTGAPVVDSGYDKWSTNDAKAEVARIRAAGGIPLRPKDFATAHAAAANVMAHPYAAQLFASGVPELTAYCRDPETGVMMRARGDWVHWTGECSAVIGDLKTSSESGPNDFEWSVDKFGYHCQQDWYQAVFGENGIDTAFVFIVVCTAPPHEVYVVELPARAVELGARRNRRALDIYAACSAVDEWPTHATGLLPIDLPERAYRREEYA